ncbi:MAG: ferritin-like domain-containing protein [Burkholderiaceae bacterium]|nr:ferritin-like domain-containing protein [Burkholderiaceae bacterium]
MLRSSALEAISLTTYAGKLLATDALNTHDVVDPDVVLVPLTPVPGREEIPVLVPPAQLRKRSMASVEGRAILIHALAHIELNAIDLGLDIVWRFSGMPDQFYRDWIHIAKEEAYHFRLLSEHLNGLGYRYGDFPAHNGLWEMAEKTRDDLLARLALVPRTLEARGLDASVPIRDKLKQVGDSKAAAILDIILRDEIGHVAVGNHWYKYLCAQRGLDPVSTYALLAKQYNAPRLRGPFNLDARRAAGFDEAELAALQSQG